jgi:hypothetical protein
MTTFIGGPYSKQTGRDDIRYALPRWAMAGSSCDRWLGIIVLMLIVASLAGVLWLYATAVETLVRVDRLEDAVGRAAALHEPADCAQLPMRVCGDCRRSPAACLGSTYVNSQGEALVVHLMCTTTYEHCFRFHPPTQCKFPHFFFSNIPNEPGAH